MSVILNSAKLREAAEVVDQIDALKARLASILGSDNVQVTSAPASTPPAATGKRTMSPAARRKISEAQKARHARDKAALEAAKAAPETPVPAAAPAPVAVAA